MLLHCTACRYFEVKFRRYTSWRELEEAAEHRENTDVLGAIGLVRKYKERTQQLVDAIKAAKVSKGVRLSSSWEMCWLQQLLCTPRMQSVC
jgi:hypothetical protein